MKRFMANLRDHSTFKQEIHNGNKRLVNHSRLPFVVVLALIGAAIATGITFGSRPPRSGRLAIFDLQRKSRLNVDEPEQTAQSTAVALPVDTSVKTRVDNSVGIEKKIYLPSRVELASPPMTLAQRSQKIPQVVEMNSGQDTEQLLTSQNLPLSRSARVPYSSAVGSNGDRDSDVLQRPEAGSNQQGGSAALSQDVERRTDRKLREWHLTKAHDFNGDLRQLPRRRPVERERRELEGPAPNPRTYIPPGGRSPQGQPSETQSGVSLSIAPQVAAPAPAPLNVFEGLDRFNWGAGSPPDTNGDVGPTYYIQTVNTSIGVFRKSDGFQEAAFTFNTFMSQGNFGNLCDTNNFGDPVVLYDTFDDRWIITDFAFLTDISGNVLAPAYQCVAASKTGNPLTGGWNFYSIQVADNLNDYPKLGIWPDGLYMSANLFSFGASSAFQGVRVWAFNKAQMYAGSPTVKIVSFDVGGGDFTVIPSNARLQTGTPPSGRPNLFVSTWLFTNALTVYKFHVDWNNISLSTFTGPDIPIAATSWPNAAVANAPQPGTATLLDVLQIRAMVQNQYTNFGGTESLWLPHTVRRADTSGFAAPRWYQLNVTGGTVGASIPQAATWDPDGANVIHRFMPSLALDRVGNMAMGYSTSNSTTEFPSIKYAGRLSADPVNTFSQTEQTFFTGTASQTGTTRWGDYSAMTLDPNGCTFWYTTEYANPADQTFNHRWLTKFGNISTFAGCTPFGAGGTVSGAVTVNPGGAPIVGATVMLGARSTTTDGSGNYSFTNIPEGTYPSMIASFPGFVSASAQSIVVTDGNTTTQNFSLTDAPDSSCLTDTTQADFLTGVGTNVDLNTSPGDVTLSNAPTVDQSNTAGTSTGTGFGTPNWTGQTIIPAVTGNLVKADVQLFCNGCGATPPDLTLSVRATSGGLPTGADLATVTIPGSAFASGSTVTYTASFGSPPTLTSGTQYALILRPVSAPAGSGYFWIRSSPSTYANGQRVLSADSGATWSSDSTRDYNFKTYMQTGYTASGNLVSSPKDANPSAGITPIWSTFSWNGATPANTSLKFQFAGSNDVNGPFSFVGPDGTAATFFTTSPVNLQPQFYNFRYLEYKALLSTTDSAATPTLNDATFCFNDVDCSSTVATITPTPAAVCSNATGNTASGPAGMTSYAWGITNGTITSATNTQSVTYTAGASGTVTLNLTVTAPNGCIVSGSQPVTVNPIPATPTITPGGPTTFGSGGSVTLTSSSATGNQWYLNGNPIGGATNQNYVATASGNYTVVVTTSGCSSAPSAATTVTVCPTTATVTNTNDSGTGSLRQAILDLCAGGTITFSNSTAGGATNFFDGSAHTITLTSGELAINQNLTITGAGANVLTISGNNASRVFNISSGTVAISNLTIANGKVSGSTDGGGILNNGTLTLTNCNLFSNTTARNGGAIYSSGTSLTLNGCTLGSASATNTALASGGAIFSSSGTLTVTGGAFDSNGAGGTAGGAINVAGGTTFVNGVTFTKNNSALGTGGAINATGGTLTLINSSISEGFCFRGGAISDNGGTINVINSTISGNTSIDDGGGIWDGSGTINLFNVTVANNRADSDGDGNGFGGGITRFGPGPVVLQNTIVAGNLRGTGTTRSDLSGSVDPTSSFNLVGDGTGSSLTNGSNGNQVGSSTSPINAMLGALANNGGATLTHLLLPGSPAINNGSNALLPTDTFDLDGDSNTAETLPVDQRGTGFSRIVNATVDIGAVEVNYTITATSGTPQSATINTAFATPLQATVKESNNVQNNISVTFTAPASGASGTFASSSTVNTNASGIATAPTFTANSMAGGPYNVVASLAGNAASANFALTNTPANQTITFGALGGKTFGDVDFNVGATASSGLTVTFTASGNCTISTNTVHLTGAGTCTITAHQAGNANYNAATDVPQGFSIAKANTTTVVTSSGNPSQLAQNVTFTATVNGPAGTGTPTGTVVFKDGGSVISCTNAGGQTLNGAGVATCQTAALTAGPHTITADYGGDTNFNISTGTLSGGQAVNNRPLISLSAATYNVNEGDGFIRITVNRSGDTAPAVTVDYATDDTGASTNCAALNTTLASSRCDYEPMFGTLQFAATETQKTLDIPINRDAYTEGPEGFTVNLSNVTGGGTLINPSSAIVTINDSTSPTPNAIDDTDLFVKQQYHDFLNREPDAPGLLFWKNNIDICNQPGGAAGFSSVAQCIEVKRIITSAAFFLSIEFMESGTFVRNAYVAALDRPATNNMPGYTEWLRDTQAVQRGVIVGQGSWQATLDANRTAFLNDFVMRAEFVGLYPTTDTPTQYVDKLYLHAAVTPGSAQERTDAIAEFGAASTASDPGARGRAVARILQNAAFRSREINRAFVQIEYFGYLRRNPNDPPDGNFNGYNFWLTKLNLFNGDFLAAEMVKAFIGSGEYRQRFGP